VAAGVGARHQLPVASSPDSGSPDAIPLAMTRMSGSTSQWLHREQLAGPPKPVWISSAMSRIPCCRVISRRRGRKAGGGTM
jgi:hypothetical protein